MGLNLCCNISYWKKPLQSLTLKIHISLGSALVKLLKCYILQNVISPPHKFPEEKDSVASLKYQEHYDTAG